MSELVKTARAGRCLPLSSRVCLIFFIDRGSLVISCRLVPPSRPCVPWGVSSFLSGRLIACLYRSCSSRPGVSFLISFYRLVSSCLLVAFFSFAFPCECSVLSRAVVHPSRRAVLPGHLACPSRFFFIRLIALRICDEAFLRGVLSVSSRWAAARSLRLARSLLIRLDGVGGIRARPVLSAHEAMRAARHWEERRDELNETAWRQACDTSGKTGNVMRTRRTARRDKTRRTARRKAGRGTRRNRQLATSVGFDGNGARDR